MVRVKVKARAGPVGWFWPFYYSQGQTMKIVQIRDEEILERIAELKKELDIKTGTGLVAHVVNNYSRLRQQKQLLLQEISQLRERLKAIDEELQQSLDELDPGKE